MLRIISLAAAGLLTVGLTACGATPNDNAGNSPSPAVTKAPDKESCSQGEALALLAGLRMAGVMLALELKTQADAAAAMGDVVEQLTEAKTKVTDPQVKAIVEEYTTAIDQLKKALDTPGADKDKLTTEIEAATSSFDKSEQKLSSICVKTPEPTTAASGGPKTAACERIMTATLALMNPMLEISMVGTDKTKLAAAITKLNTALDTYAGELTKAAGETTDSAFKAALTTAAADVAKMKTAIAGAASDPTKVEDIVSDDKYSASQEKLQTFCE